MRIPHWLACLLFILVATSVAGSAVLNRVPEPGTDSPSVPDTLDELFTDCYVEDWSGAVWHATCGDHNIDDSTYLSDHEGLGEAYDSTRLRLEAERERQRGERVSEGTLFHRGEWPMLLRLQTGEPGHTVVGAYAHLPGAQGGLRRLTCRDPLGRCKVILQRAATRDYRHAAVFPPRAPSEASPGRQRVEALLNDCIVLRLGGNALLATCDDLEINVSWFAQFDSAKRTVDRDEQRRKLMESVSESAEVSNTAFLWEEGEVIALRGTESTPDGDHRPLLAVASMRNARWTDLFLCNGPTSKCDTFVRQMLAERPPYANVRDVTPAITPALRAAGLVGWVLIALFGLVNLATVALLVSGLSARAPRVIRARARIAARIALLIVALPILGGLGLAAYWKYLTHPSPSGLWTADALVELGAPLAVTGLMSLVLPITVALVLSRRARRLGKDTHRIAPIS